MNPLTNFFHALHVRELVEEYGFVGALIAGVFVAVELSPFPFWQAVNDLVHGQGNFSFAGPFLKYTRDEWAVPPGSSVLASPAIISTNHTLDLRWVAGCIVAAFILGSIGVSHARQVRRRSSHDADQKSNER